jgi:hypothetical protein
MITRPNTSTSEYPQCRDVSWNVLKNPARGACRMDVYIVDGNAIRGAFRMA